MSAVSAVYKTVTSGLWEEIGADHLSRTPDNTDSCPRTFSRRPRKHSGPSGLPISDSTACEWHRSAVGHNDSRCYSCWQQIEWRSCWAIEGCRVGVQPEIPQRLCDFVSSLLRFYPTTQPQQQKHSVSNLFTCILINVESLIFNVDRSFLEFCY